MVGYGPEDTHFVVELTYNYNVNSYDRGNDYQGITIRSREAIVRAKSLSWPIKDENGVSVVEAPGGYKFYLIDEPQPTDKGIGKTLTLQTPGKSCGRGMFLFLTSKQQKEMYSLILQLKTSITISMNKNLVSLFKKNRLRVTVSFKLNKNFIVKKN